MTEKKRGRKPIGNTPMTPAQRQSERRMRLKQIAAEDESDSWTEAVCLDVLNSSKWRRGAIDKAAWEQLGRLRGFI